ncbi:clotting factor G beta subunit-like [Oppia nitens]|uniref:clotting factor G beta subunit-like n=1 Tax=Oppia nitens TaxID=1686743 RepID=UPI0023DA8BE6|nr:clotting factor G beta subunit-like [Oppia nitens]
MRVIIALVISDALNVTVIICFSVNIFARNINNTSEDEYVVCDHKLINGSIVASGNGSDVDSSRENLCKVECYTKLKNPGFCQIHALNPCKTMNIMDIESESVVKCRQNKDTKEVKFLSICCPFKDETNQISLSTETTNITTTTTTSTTTPSPNKKFDCGKRPNIAAIVGGISSQPNTWPWIVSIYERQGYDNRPRFICGGTIINEHYILSAAHCFVRYGQGVGRIRPNRFVIKVGAHRLSDPKIAFIELSHINVHKDYSSMQHYNDIALLKVRHKIEFLPTVGPICLPIGSKFAKFEEFIGRPTKLVGWGATRFGGPVSDELREVNVNIIDNKDCHRNYTQLNGLQNGFPNGINHLLMCAGIIGGGKDSCQGDSGGPLAMAIDDQWYEMGIVSFGYKCAEPGFPGIYTRVKHHMDWIQQNTK